MLKFLETLSILSKAYQSNAGIIHFNYAGKDKFEVMLNGKSVGYLKRQQVIDWINGKTFTLGKEQTNE